MSNGNVAIVTDEVFGVGLLVLDPSNSGGGGGGGATITSAPTPAPAGGSDANEDVDRGNGASQATKVGLTSLVVAAIAAMVMISA